MATGLLATGESITVSFMWEDDDGAPLTSLSPTPTLAVTNPAGSVTLPSLTQRGSTAFWDYVITPDAVGTWVLQARCTDTDCAAEYTDPVALWVTSDSVSDIQAKTDQLHFTGSLGSEKVNAIDTHNDAKIALIGTTGATVPRENDENEITMYLETTYSVALGTSKDVSSDSSVDYSGGTAVLKFGDYSLPVTIAGTSGAWVFQIEMSVAQGDAIGTGTWREARVIVTKSAVPLAPAATLKLNLRTA